MKSIFTFVLMYTTAIDDYAIQFISPVNLPAKKCVYLLRGSRLSVRRALFLSDWQPSEV